MRIELEIKVKLKEVNLEYYYVEWAWNKTKCGIPVQQHEAIKLDFQ